MLLGSESVTGEQATRTSSERTHRVLSIKWYVLFTASRKQQAINWSKNKELVESELVIIYT